MITVIEQPPADPALSAHQIKPQLRDLWVDLRELGLDYLKLYNLKMHTGTTVAKQAFACLLVACALTPIGLAGLIYGLMGLLVAKLPEVHEGAVVATAGGTFCVVLAALAAFGCARCLKHLLPTSS